MQTPLNAWHRHHSAKLVDFAGWEMPLQFSKVMAEHQAVRQAAGVFDICHMGLLSLTGVSTEQTVTALNPLVPQDLTKLVAGKAVYTQFLNPQGGVIDDVIIYQLNPPYTHFPELTQVLIICNASNAQTVQAWLKQHLPPEVSLDVLNAQYALLAFQGPQFEAVLRQLSPDLGLPKRFTIAPAVLAQTPVLLSRTGYTGEDGVEIIVSTQAVETLWDALLQAGETFGVLPIGLAARDTLRLEAAYPLHGHEITPEITPLEAGLGWSVKLEQAADFIGKSALLAQKQTLSRHTVCLTIDQKMIPRTADLIYDHEAATAPIGVVTSGSISPTLGHPIALGLVEATLPPAVGTSLWIAVRNTRVCARVTRRPFYPPPVA